MQAVNTLESPNDSFFDNEDEVRSECSSHQDDDYDEGKTL